MSLPTKNWPHTIAVRDDGISSDLIFGGILGAVVVVMAVFAALLIRRNKKAFLKVATNTLRAHVCK